MQIEHMHRRDFRLRYDDVDSRALAKPVAILNLLEEAASSHCERAGWDVFRLMREGFGWVLLRGGFEMFRYPRYGEGVEIETWVSSARRFQAEREYRIVSTEGANAGEVLGYSRALWLFLDCGKRRPASIIPDYLEAWAPGGGLAGDMALTEIEGPDPARSPARPAPDPGFAVRNADIDTNGHVNNVVYLGWALEAMPPDAREGSVLRRIRAQWKHEVTYGATAIPVSASEGEGSFRLGVWSRSNGEDWLAAAAESTWEPLAAG